MEADISNIFQDIKNRGEHADHTDFVQKLFGLSNIEAAKKISADFGLSLDHVEFAPPVEKRKIK